METTTNNSPTITNGIIRALFYLITGFMLCGIIQLLYDNSINKGVYIEISDTKNISQVLLSYFIMKIGLVICAFLFMVLVNREPLVNLGFAWKNNGSHAVAGFIIGVAIINVGTIILLFSNNISLSYVAFNNNDILFSTLLCVVVAFIEEISIRGYVLRNLMQGMNKWLALGVSSLVFALLHLDNAAITIIAFVNILLAGVLLGVNYVYTKNLWFSIFLHFSWNFFQGTIFGYKVSGIHTGKSIFTNATMGLDIVSGGNFGFEGSLVCTILQVLTIAGLIWYYQKIHMPKATL
jgi:hypothetical protein